MKNTLVTFLAMVALVAAGSVNAAGNKEAGKAKSAACAACHGADGNSAIAQNPKLAGQSAGYLLKQLQEFKSKKRDNAVMYGMAAGLSDEDMADLAAYYASNKGKAGVADETLVMHGEQIYRSGDASKGLSACIGCHGPNGAGNPAAKFPALQGQHSDYVVSQLQAFSAGARANDAGKMMQNIAGKMNPADMKAVASYIQGLQ
jgi:cytochrome c553